MDLWKNGLDEYQLFTDRRYAGMLVDGYPPLITEYVELPDKDIVKITSCSYILKSYLKRISRCELIADPIRITVKLYIENRRNPIKFFYADIDKRFLNYLRRNLPDFLVEEAMALYTFESYYYCYIDNRNSKLDKLMSKMTPEQILEFNLKIGV